MIHTHNASIPNASGEIPERYAVPCANIQHSLAILRIEQSDHVLIDRRGFPFHDGGNESAQPANWRPAMFCNEFRSSHWISWLSRPDSAPLCRSENRRDSPN